MTKPERELAPEERLRLLLSLALFAALCTGLGSVRYWFQLGIAGLFTLAVPLLLGLNLLLVFVPDGCLEIVYRLLLLGLFPLVWNVFIQLDPAWRTGNEGRLWAHPLAVTAAAGVEIAIVVMERKYWRGA